MSNYLDKSLFELHDLLINKVIKPIDLVNEAFDRINKSDLNSFITVCTEEAISKAISIENNIEVDNVFWGIPIAIKDNIITKDIKTTAASKMLSSFVPLYNAHVIDLLNEKNMIIIGKLNMDEFAMGSSNGTSYFGPVKNPWNKKLVSGGSSGGSCAAVSNRLVPFSLGTDTGGSIRQPSAFCGTVGLKPTYGRVSRYGLIAFASSLDQIGPITRNVYENAMLLNILCGKDDRDLTQVSKEEDFTRLIGKDIDDLKIAIPKFYISDQIDSEILSKIDNIRSLLSDKGISIDVIDIPFIEYAVPLYQVIALGEASSNLARYDGIKYGYRNNDSMTCDDLISSTRDIGFGDEVKRRIMIGSFMLSGENAKEYYTKALKIRNRMSKEFEKVFSSYDLIIGPTTTCLPYEIGDSLNDPNKAFLDDILTIPVNMAGLPAISIPIGFSDNNLPIGLQIIGNKFDEARIYQLADYIEKKLNLNLNSRGEDNE